MIALANHEEVVYALALAGCNPLESHAEYVVRFPLAIAHLEAYVCIGLPVSWQLVYARTGNVDDGHRLRDHLELCIGL